MVLKKLSILTIAVAVLACGSSDSGGAKSTGDSGSQPADTISDAGSNNDMCADALVAVGAAQTLLLSEIQPGQFIELFNPTATALKLADSDLWLCSPFVYFDLKGEATTRDVVVPARGYATIPWPPTFQDTAAGGEVILYRGRDFGDGTKIADFVCWGSNPHGTRKTLAESVSAWQGACAEGPLAEKSLHRRANTDGRTAAAYDTQSAPSPMNCSKQP